MNSSARLDSAVFQLTPTRTRFDLVITVNGKKEKIASGLLSPFLSHLKAAQDQMAKGGYSIFLEPEGGRDATWFTRGTVERFVRFVNTPEILERVYTIESEILQIEEAIAIQGNNSLGISTVEENQVKHVENTEGRKAQQDTNEEKAIVLYKPDAQPPEANGSIASEGNSKVHLLKVLETRKSVLQKEQGMAFARAVAAGFDIDYIPVLMSFAECFGASRLMDACTNFRDLWKRKHETGQWLEIAADEVMSNRSDFSALHASGVILPNMASGSHTELDSENNVKASSDLPPMDRQSSVGHQDNNIQGQFPHYMFPPWPVHSPPGAVPVFPPYPVQGIPYYQTYPGNSPFMQPTYPPMEDPSLIASQNMGHRRHSMDSRHNNTESETWDVEASKSRLQDGVDMEREGSQTGDRRKKASRLGRQKSGTVVIRNINYITKTENSSGSGSYSDSASETDEDKDNQESVKTSKRRGFGKESSKKLNSSDKEETDHGKDADGGHWQAFQNCLLRDADEDRHDIDQGQFDQVKVGDMRRKKHIAVNDPLVFSERDMHEVQGNCTIDMHSISNGLTHMPKASNDALLLSGRAGQSGDGRSADDVQSIEVNGRRGGYRRAASDDFIIPKQESQFGNSYPSSYMETASGPGYSNNNVDRKLSHDMNDDSYILEYRSIQVNEAGNVERNAIDMDSEFPMLHQKEEKSSYETNRINYLPDDLSMMPERGAERGSMSYDPALDYEMQAQAGGVLQDKNKKVLADTKPGTKRLDKEPKSKVTPKSADKTKSVGPIRRGKTSKLSPLDEARARAEKLRNYKADLQKMKKEKEEEEKKRLEALKMERQKRIASKSSSITMQSPVPSQLTKKQFPTKLSPSFHKGSKFSDSEPGPSSPLQRFPIKTVSVGSNDSLKASKTSRLNTKSHLDDSKLSRSVSSLPESKLEKGDSTTDSKASMARIRRLSEPKMSTIRQTSSVKPNGTRTISKTKAADGPESKKISAIVSHDKSRTAALPELKVRTPKASEIVHNRASVKEKTQKLNDNKSSMNSDGTILKKNEMGTSSNDDGDDNPVVEKTVVMLECEKPYAPAIRKPEEKFGIPKKHYDNDEVTEKTETAANYVAIRAPISPLSMDIIDKETSESQSHLQPISTEVIMDYTGKEPSKSSSVCITETYHAPYARVSSMEDPSTRNSEYGKSAPTSLETAAIGVETVKAHVSDTRNSTLEKIPEAIEKPQVKESSKGFRRLLKFGKKSHSSATAGGNMESHNVSIDGSEADEVGTNDSSNEVHTLKNLIAQDETPTASTTQHKSSRSFSLLSPFRGKNSEKKIMMA
ncbi:COP1-interacting protein 7-like [Gastrolobium bilobum]|uniref:COP1-interacting protein 7-like n=1 Tax=Gastrolobium bilobum TaxID=150636 RepID=UPI002AB2766F|nr:COP1-interacting protein 7-like [Gastrolobium bilobum]